MSSFEKSFRLIRLLQTGRKVNYTDLQSELGVGKKASKRLIDEASRFFPVMEEIRDRKRFFWMMAR